MSFDASDTFVGFRRKASFYTHMNTFALLYKPKAAVQNFGHMSLFVQCGHNWSRSHHWWPPRDHLYELVVVYDATENHYTSCRVGFKDIYWWVSELIVKTATGVSVGRCVCGAGFLRTWVLLLTRTHMYLASTVWPIKREGINSQKGR